MTEYVLFIVVNYTLLTLFIGAMIEVYNYKLATRLEITLVIVFATIVVTHLTFY